MKRAIFVTVFALAFCAGVFAQSGRRIAPVPSPSPTVKSDDPTGYSESKPRARAANRIIPILNRAPVNPSQSETTVNSAVDDKSDGETLRIETNLITIPVSVFDRYGLYIPGIRQSEFKIFEDGVEQEIAYFATTDKPITVALVLDVSPSTEYRIEEIRRAAVAFVDKLLPQDSVIVIKFDHGIDVLTKATKDRQKIYKAIDEADFGWGTSLYNAVDEALRKQLSKIEGRKAVVLFTDGVDTTSRKNSYDSTMNYAEESDSLIFPIYYNTYLDNRRRSGGILGGIYGGSPPGTTAGEYSLGRQYLEELAAATGGHVFRPEATPGGLTRAFEGIAEELRRQYNIGYVPKDEGKPGQRKQIKVRVERPGLLIRARDSYVVGTTSAPPTPAPQKPQK
jgi:Ca-activated chloride channel family protein